MEDMKKPRETDNSLNTLLSIGYAINRKNHRKYSKKNNYGGFFIKKITYDVDLVGLSYSIFNDYIKPRIYTTKMRERIYEIEKYLGLDVVHPSTKDFLKLFIKEDKNISTIYGHPEEHRRVVKSSSKDKFGLAEEIQLDQCGGAEISSVIRKMNKNVTDRPFGSISFNEFKKNWKKDFIICTGGVAKDGIAKSYFKDIPIRTNYKDPLHPITYKDIETNKTYKYVPTYEKDYYSSDIGIIAIGRHPHLKREYILTVFGSHAYGTLGAIKAITLKNGVPLDPSLINKYSIKKIDKKLIEEMTKVINEEKPNFCFTIIDVELEEGQITRINPFYGNENNPGPGPFWG